MAPICNTLGAAFSICETFNRKLSFQFNEAIHIYLRTTINDEENRHLASLRDEVEIGGNYGFGGYY